MTDDRLHRAPRNTVDAPIGADKDGFPGAGRGRRGDAGRRGEGWEIGWKFL